MDELVGQDRSGHLQQEPLELYKYQSPQECAGRLRRVDDILVFWFHKYQIPRIYNSEFMTFWYFGFTNTNLLTNVPGGFAGWVVGISVAVGEGSPAAHR